MNRPLVAVLVWTGALVPFAPASLSAQADSSLLTLDRIYASSEFETERLGPTQWVDGGAGYTRLEPAANGHGADLVRYDTELGTRRVLVPASRLVPPGATEPLEVEDYTWSPDGKQLLIFTNSRPVWRQNNRGDYWLLDLASGRLRQLGGPDARPSSLLFAEFSPDGTRIGYVRDHDLYVERVDDGRITRLTTDGSRTIINGTFDWVYEEELDLRDGWRWSPDGRTIAYWQLNADSVRDFLLIDDTDSLYSFTNPVQYPKAGSSNSAARIGFVSTGGGPTRWLAIAGNPRNNYLARMDWAASSDEVVIQRLNRLQDTNRVLLGDRRTGKVRTIFTDSDSAWVDVGDAMVWLKDGSAFTWMSERDGWRHLYLVSRDGRSVKLLTPGAFDVIDFVALDERGGSVYYIASPDNPAQRYLFRARLDGRARAERLSPANEPGTHDYDVSPDHRFALHEYSRFDVPPVVDLVRLPGHAAIRTLVDNAQLKAKLARLRHGKLEFFKVDLPDGTRAPAWVMRPADFDSTSHYPLLFYVYGGPATQTVLDRWLGVAHYLFHLYLTQQGFAVASVDNRGTPAPLGRAWRKVIYGRLGVLETEEQAAAARILGRIPWVDSTRIGIWGWSNGGYLSLDCLFRFGNVYRAAIAVAPVTHWALYDDIYTERYNGLPDQNREGYAAGSPLTYASKLTGDLLLIHGSGDDNVHFQNSEMLVNALVAADKPFQMMDYPNRNHSLRGGKTRLHMFELMTRFLREKLAGGGARAVEPQALH
ncbi:MAG TPA: S9 family peptidase [Gemmatimonadales bacterium]|nr:S9 family peptidase [Gemmatimonadales bacterium]